MNRNINDELMRKLSSYFHNTFSLAGSIINNGSCECENKIAISRALAYNPQSSIINRLNIEHQRSLSTIIKKLEICLENFERSNEHLIMAGRCYCLVQDYPNCFASYLNALKRCIKLEPIDWFVLGSMYQRFQYYDSSLKCYDNIGNLGCIPANVVKDLSFRKALVYRKLRKYKNSDNEILNCTSAPPGKFNKNDMKLQYIGSLYYQGRISESFVELDNLLKLFPKCEILHIQKCLIVNKVGSKNDMHKKLNEFLSVKDMFPNNKYINILVAIVYYNMKDYVSSLSYFSKCFTGCDNRFISELWLAVGNIYFNQCNYTDSEKAYQMCVTYDGTNVRAWLNLGFTVERNKHYESALKIYERGAEISASNEFKERIIGIKFNKPCGSLIEFEEEKLIPMIFDVSADEYLKTPPLIDGESVQMNDDDIANLYSYPPSCF